MPGSPITGTRHRRLICRKSRSMTRRSIPNPLERNSKTSRCSMISPHASASRFDLRALLGAAVLCAAVPAGAAPYYVPLTPSMNDRTGTLNGHDLTIDQILMVARHGPQVELSPEARHTPTHNYGFLLQTNAPGTP